MTFSNISFLMGSVAVQARTKAIPVAAPPPSGGGAYDAAGQNSYYDALYANAFANLTHSSVKYVKTPANGGSDTNNGNSLATAYATVDKARTAITGNGLILVDDGSYTIGTNGWVNETTLGAVPSGTGSNWTVIRAINPGSVVLNQASQAYYGSILRGVSSGQVWIDGITFLHDTVHNDEPIFLIGDTWRMTRCFFRRRQSGTYGATTFLGTGSLIQDCAIYGAGRYLMNTGSNSGSTPVGQNVFRRIAARLDWAFADQPVASFAHYGSDDGNYLLSKETLFANLMEFDSPCTENQASFGFRWGSIYNPKHQRDMRVRGGCFINCGTDLANIRTDNIGAPTMDVRDCFISDNDNNNQGGSPNAIARANGTLTIDHISARAILSATKFSATTNLSTNNHLLDGSIVYGTKRVGGNGSEIMYSHGAFLSHWGDTNFDTVSTTDKLWPYPYEDRIKAFMDTQISKPTGHFPASPTSSRQSFQGVSLGGQEMTLTRRVWEAAGNQIPDLSTMYV